MTHGLFSTALNRLVNFGASFSPFQASSQSSASRRALPAKRSRTIGTQLGVEPMSCPQGIAVAQDKCLSATPPVAATAQCPAACVADRTEPSQVPREQVAKSRHPRVRWWQIANDHLLRLVMDPVVEWSTPEFRGVDIMDIWGFRIHRASGAITHYGLTACGGWLHRNYDVSENVLVVGGNPGTGWIGWLIGRHAAHWAQLAGMPPEHIPQQWNRLLKTLAQRWEANGVINRLWRITSRALALDDEVLRLVRATSQSAFGPDAVFLSNYQHCLNDRANLLIVEREAPQLLRLYVMLLPSGAGEVEPKLALKRAFLDAGRRPPRLWRTMCRFDADTLDKLAAHGACIYMPPLADWIDLLLALDLPCQPPTKWLFGLRHAFGNWALSRNFAVPWARPVFTTHLMAWMAADESTRASLFLELENVCFDLLNLAVPPMPPPANRSWRSWVRWAARMQAEHFESEAEAARAWDASRGLTRQHPEPTLRGTRIELRRLLTSHALYEEGRVMKHCIHDWRDHLVDDTAAIYSVHLAHTGEHIGTAAIELDGRIEVRGPVNGLLNPKDSREVAQLLRREQARALRERVATIRPADVDVSRLKTQPIGMLR